jgi:hypothetical protein
MFTKSSTSLRWLSAYVLTLLLFCLSFSKGAEAQATAPLVTASYAQTLTPPSGLGTVFQTALDSSGDWLVVDYANGAIYEYPVNGGAVITLVAAGGLGSFNNPGIAIDSNNDLYLEANFNNCLLLFPYDTTTKTWDGLATVTPANTTADICPGAGGGTSPFIFAQYGLAGTGSTGFFQPWAIAVNSQNNLIISSQNSPVFVFSLDVTGSGSTAKAGSSAEILTGLSARPQSIAQDPFGNIYLVEETDQKTPLPGVLEIPAGSTSLITTDAGLSRVDPNLPAVTGVTTDAAGNLYITDSTDGVFLVPAATSAGGTPQTSSAVLLSPVLANGQLSLDQTRNILYVPTTQSGTQTLTKVSLKAAQLGTTATGAPAATSQSVLFSFNGAVTPASFAIEEAGTATPDFTIATGGTCAAGTAYAAKGSCTENVTLSPNAAGNVSAKLLMLDASGNTLASLTLQGNGTGPALQVSPAAESTIGASLKTPTQVAVDAGDNTYVADSGLGAVEMYPKGYGAVAAVTTVGTGLTAPTGVAVDGAGDVFIADNGNVYEVPNGPTGLNAAGQITLKGALGPGLNLASDGLDDLYIADPQNHHVVKLGSLGGTFGPLTQTETDMTGFTTPSAVAVDASGNLYVVDGTNLLEVTTAGTQSTLLMNLSNPTGVAVDPSGSVYVAMTGGTLRYPTVSGVVSTTGQPIAPTVTSPTSVAIDSTEDIYITDAVAEDVNFLSADASLNFGTLTSATATQSGTITVLNEGNAPFNFTMFSSTPDYSATTTNCAAPQAVGSTCTATITFNPGPGDQGTLTTLIQALSGAANTPVGANVTGVGVSLAASTTTMSVTNASVDGASAIITVAPSAGTGTAPTGQVTLTITGPTLTAPVVVTATLAGAPLTIAPPQLPAGTYTYTASYQGDRVYGSSSATSQVMVAVGVVTLMQDTTTAFQAIDAYYPYVLATGNGSDEPFDSSATQFEYNYPVQVIATDGTALIGQPVTDSKGTVVGTNYGSVTYQVVENYPTAGATGTSTNCIPVQVESNGTAPFATDCFAIDTSNDSIPDLLTTYTITPMYTPVGTGANIGFTNPNYASVSGTPINFTALRNPVVQISSNPSSLTLTPGTSTTATLTLSSLLGYGIAGAGASQNNYTLPVQLSCDGLPAYATCSFSYPTPDPTDPQSVDVGPPAGTMVSYEGATAAPCAAAPPGGQLGQVGISTGQGGCYGPGTVILTINTNIPTGDTASLHRGPGKTTFAAIFGLGLLGFAFGKKKSLRGRALTLVCLLLCSGVVAGISGCSTKQLGTTSSTSIVTPAGTYMVQITAVQVGSQNTISGTTPKTVFGTGSQMSLPFTIPVTVNGAN